MIISAYNFSYITWFVLISCLLLSCIATTSRKLAFVEPPPLIPTDHKGPLLKGNLTVNLIWYGNFTSTQRSIIIDFINSLSPNVTMYNQPSVSSWWQITDKYRGGPCTITLGDQSYDEHCSFGDTLSPSQIAALASRLPHNNSINIVLSSDQVLTDAFCWSTCGFHGYNFTGKHNKTRFPYIWVGNAVNICSGICAATFNTPYVSYPTGFGAPNNDVGIDSMIIQLAKALAGAVTNPFDSGYFNEPEPGFNAVELVDACVSTWNLYPGDYLGKIFFDPSTNATFNAYGIHGRKYLLPPMWDLSTSSCKTHI